MKMRKKMNYVVVMALGFALTGAALAGCGESRQPRQDAREDGSRNVQQEIMRDSAADEAETEAAGKNDQAAAVYEDNFAVDSKAAEEFAGKVKEAVANKDLGALADLTAFPVYVDLPDVKVVETKEEFLQLGAEALFTEELLKSIETADIENLEPSMAGFSISGGGSANINFGVVDGALAISGINY